MPVHYMILQMIVIVSFINVNVISKIIWLYIFKTLCIIYSCKYETKSCPLH